VIETEEIAGAVYISRVYINNPKRESHRRSS
jgi:hypothetical protein